MGQRFKKLEKKIRRATIIKFSALGLSLGVLVAAVLAIAQKLMMNAPNLILCIGLGACVAIVSAFIALLLAFPTQKRIAKQLDDHLALNEKVQTMVAFQEEQGAILEIQRQDTERILSETSMKRLRRKRALLNLVLPLLACAVLATSVLMPVRAEPSNPADGENEQNDVWELTEWHITAVRALIEEVKSSETVEEGKTGVVETLERLLVELEPVKTKTQMKQTVIASMVKIDGVIDNINTYTALIRSMRNSSSTKIKELADAIGSPADPIVESKYQALKADLAKEDLAEVAGNLANALTVAVDAAKVPATDALYLALKEFSGSLIAFAEATSTLSADEATEGLTRVFETAAESISLALNQQHINRTTGDSTNNELMSIFGILWSELPDELKYPDDEEAGTTDDEYKEQEDEIINAGGKGDGEVIYGSNDAIYYPADETHVRYGDVIDEYNSQKAAALEGRPLSDELKEFIDEYFADLYYNDKNK